MAKPVIWDFTVDPPRVKDSASSAWRTATPEEIFVYNVEAEGISPTAGDANVPPPPGSAAGDTSLPSLQPGFLNPNPDLENAVGGNRGGGGTPAANITIDEFMAALRMVESGGNYKAYNSYSGASGAYQFLDSTWGGYGGYRSARDAPPAVQDARARQLMLQYYNQFGSWELVAVAWHAGPGSAAKVANGQATPGSFYDPGANTTTADYINAVFGNLGVEPGGGLSVGVGAGFNSTVLSDEEALAQLGYAAWYLEHPELGPILREATRSGWSKERLQAAIQRTNWWQTTAESNRAWTDLLNTDPATAEQQLLERMTTIGNEAQRLGVNLPDDRLWKIADESIRYGWNDEQLAAAMAAEAKYQPDQTSGRGELGTSVTDIKAMASSYMVSVSDEDAWNYAQRIVAGTLTMEGLSDTFKARSLARFPQLAEYINAGITPDDYFAEHRNTASQLLGMPVTNIDMMNDPEFSRALGFDPGDGTIRPMTVPEFTKMVRGTDRYGNSDRGQAEISTLGEGILRMFGKVK